jgi:hypothetical protein
MSFWCNFGHKWTIKATGPQQSYSTGPPICFTSYARIPGVRTCCRCGESEKIVKHGSLSKHAPEPNWEPLKDNLKEAHWNECYAASRR